VQNSNQLAAPRRIVALGGGTGLPNVLRGLRFRLERKELDDVVAVVTMTDDGGSSGRLRRTRGLPPPGDLRNCLVALAAEEDLMARLFQHRYNGNAGLGGHTVGNLILAALAEQTGSFLEAVEMSGRVLRVVGRILPATLDRVKLRATMEDGSTVVGETRIRSSEKAIRRVSLRPSSAQPTPGVIDAVRQADVVVLGPGSLFTSVVPHLLIEGLAAALRETQAVVVLVGNIVGEPGETTGLDAAAQLRVLEEHAGGALVDAVLVHDGPIDPAVLARYESEGSPLLAWPDALEGGPCIVRRRLVAPGFKIRHDPTATADALVDVWREARPRLAVAREAR
jgi:uncharacterized cofD-like protein